MFKEIGDIKKVCKTINSNLDEIKKLVTNLEKLLEEIKSKAIQEEGINVTLAIRKELTNLFILNSNIADNFNTMQRIFKSTKGEFLKILKG